MPIYYGAGGLLKVPWTLETKMSIKDLRYYRAFLRKAKSKFDKNYDRVFCDSIKLSGDFDNQYIAEFDSRATNMEIGLYQNYLEDLIFEANKLLSKKKPNRKFDIAGSWTSGYIILMKNKK